MDRIRMLVAAVGFSALCAHSPAQADPPVGARDEGPIFVTVNELYGRVLEATEDSVLVEFVDLPGSRSRIPLELVPPDQRYRLKKRTIDADDAAAWLKLADFAKELGLHVRHIEALETAKALDPSLEGVEERLGDARQNCAVERLSHAQELRAQGALRDAIAHLETTIR
ncbi:MAG TPA: hypothetical protein VK081_02910, partial [Planctomycetota bacterium]|nr:hypothetical protein [Planctomycetota bacterium]